MHMCSRRLFGTFRIHCNHTPMPTCGCIHPKTHPISSGHPSTPRRRRRRPRAPAPQHLAPEEEQDAGECPGIHGVCFCIATSRKGCTHVLDACAPSWLCSRGYLLPLLPGSPYPGVLSGTPKNKVWVARPRCVRARILQPAFTRAPRAACSARPPMWPPGWKVAPSHTFTHSHSDRHNDSRSHSHTFVGPVVAFLCAMPVCRPAIGPAARGPSC